MMARRRMLSPEIWHNRQFGSLTVEQRLLYIGLISMADDEGFFVADPRAVGAEIFPWDPKICGRRVQKNIVALQKIGLIGVEIYNGDKKIAIGFHPNWENWQRVEKMRPSQLRRLTSLRSGNDSGNDSGRGSGNDSDPKRSRSEVKINTTPLTPLKTGGVQESGQVVQEGGNGKDLDQQPPVRLDAAAGPAAGTGPATKEWIWICDKAGVDYKWAAVIWKRTHGLREKLLPKAKPGYVVVALAHLLDKQDQAKAGYGERINNPEKWCRALMEREERELPERPDIPWPGAAPTAGDWQAFTEFGAQRAGVDYEKGPPAGWVDERTAKKQQELTEQKNG